MIGPLADKGFPKIAHDWQNKGIFVSMPPQKHGEEQFTPEENELAYNISKLRVHIERDYSQTMSTLKNLPFYYLVTTLRCLIKV